MRSGPQLAGLGDPGSHSLVAEPGVTHLCLSVSLRDVFPQGLPDEYAFVTTFRFRKSSRKEDWYTWQVIDQYGIPQVRATPVAGARGSPCPRAGLLRPLLSSGLCAGLGDGAAGVWRPGNLWGLPHHRGTTSPGGVKCWRSGGDEDLCPNQGRGSRLRSDGTGLSAARAGFTQGQRMWPGASRTWVLVLRPLLSGRGPRHVVPRVCFQLWTGTQTPPCMVGRAGRTGLALITFVTGSALLLVCGCSLRRRVQPLPTSVCLVCR